MAGIWRGRREGRQFAGLGSLSSIVLFGSVGFAALISLGLVLFGRGVIHLWVGDVSLPSVHAPACIGALDRIQAAGSAAAMLLNGAHIVTFQVWVAVVTAIVAITLKLEMVHSLGVFARSGVPS